MLPAKLLTGIVTAAAIVGGGCSRDLRPLPIGLEFRQELPGQCPSSSCEAYGLQCGAVVSIRAYRASSSPVEESEPLTESCLPVPSDSTLCALAGIVPDLDSLPAERVRLEVAVWSPEDIAGDCPSGPIFDLAGIPLSTFDPPPAFAGFQIIDVGNENLDNAAIELACYDSDPLASCGTDITEVLAEIDDLDTLLFAPPLTAVNLRVSVGVPKPQAGGDGTVFVLDAADANDLDLARTLPVPQFSAIVEETFADTICLQVLDLTPQSTTAVTCTTIDSSLARLELRGFLVTANRVQEVLAALGEGTFPSSGVVIGRVIDSVNQPVAGATVSTTTPTGDSAEVFYFSQDFATATVTGTTASHGYFASVDAPYGTRWQASHGDGRVEAMEKATGLIEGRVTALTIPLADL